MNKDLTKAEKAFHIDLALACAQEDKQGQALSFREISELSGLKIQRVQSYYDSAMDKVERRLNRIIKEELNGEK